MSPSLELQSHPVVIRGESWDERIEAWRRPSWPGLVVHFDGGSEWRGTYRITHEASGRAIGEPISTERYAILVADRLASLGDWTRPASEILDDLKFHHRARAVLRAYGVEPAISVPSTSRGL